MVNKIGDVAVLLAIAVAYGLYHSLDFSVIFSLTPYVVQDCGLLGVESITLVSFFLFVGAIGKSAQLGLHT